MAEFNENNEVVTYHQGDRVLVNGAPATIEVYDKVVNQLVYSSELPGGATNTTYGHISNTRIELLETTRVEYTQPAEQDALPLDEDVNPVADALQEVGNVEAAADENPGSEK